MNMRKCSSSNIVLVLVASHVLEGDSFFVPSIPPYVNSPRRRVYSSNYPSTFAPTITALSSKTILSHSASGWEDVNNELLPYEDVYSILPPFVLKTKSRTMATKKSLINGNSGEIQNEVRSTISTTSDSSSNRNIPSIPDKLPKLSELMEEESMIRSIDGSNNKKNVPSFRHEIAAEEKIGKITKNMDENAWKQKRNNNRNGKKKKDRTKLVNPLSSNVQVVGMAERTLHSNLTIAVKKQKKKSSNKTEQKPWKADYASSRKTQGRITLASKYQNGDSALDCARRVLTVLLDTPPILCNEANIVHSLTLTAKILNRRRQPSKSQSQPKNTKIEDTFLELLHQTLDILHDLVKEGCLNTRQLSNAAWAVAKHYSMDPRVLPPSKATLASIGNRPTMYENGNTILIKAETWDLNNAEGDASSVVKKKRGYEREKRVLKMLDLIAERLIAVMKIKTNDNRNMMHPPKSSELSMVSWAYAILKPRISPPGWDLPPRSGRMVGNHRETLTSTKAANGSRNDLVSFEKWDDYASLQEQNKHNDGGTQMTMSATVGQSKSISITNMLFDTIASTLLKYDIKDKQNGKSMIEGCLWRELSNIAWAYAHSGQSESDVSLEMMQVLTDEASQRLQNFYSSSDVDSINTESQQFLPRDISQIAWALGNLQCDNYRFSDALISFVDTITTTLVPKSNDNLSADPNNKFRPFREWRSADLVQVAVALAHGRIDKPELLIPIYNEVLHSTNAEFYETMPTDKYGKTFKSWELAVLLWAQASLYMTGSSGRVFEEFSDIVPPLLLLRMQGVGDGITNDRDCAETGQLINSFKRIGLGVQEQANIAWSLAVLEKYQASASIKLLQNIFTVCTASCTRGNPIGLEHAHQLWQSVCILEDECIEALDKLEGTTFYSFLRDSWFQEKSRPKISSARHKNISKTLDLMGVQHFNEHDEDIDVAIVLKLDSEWTHTADKGKGTEIKRKVAVEFDGPSHFTRPRSPMQAGQKSAIPRSLGHTVLKYKILKRQGWTVIRVPYYEFDKIPFWASMERQRYLQRKLKTHANIRFSRIDVSEYKAQVANRQSRFD